jgi:hypothetical protein
VSFSSSVVFLLLEGPAEPPERASYPQLATTAVFSTTWVWAAPLSLATTQGILSAPAGTKMFQFPAFPQHRYVFPVLYLAFYQVGFPIRIPPDLRLHTTPRGFSQCTASFFGP